MSGHVILDGLSFRRDDLGHWLSEGHDAQAKSPMAKALNRIAELEAERVLPDGYMVTYATEFANGTIQLTCKPIPTESETK